MRVLLSDSDEHDWLASCVDHVEGGSHLLVHSIELGHDDAINSTRVLVLNGKVNQGLVELG